MKKILVLVLAGLFVTAFASFAGGKSEDKMMDKSDDKMMKSEEFSGILTDVNCATSGMSPEGTNMKTHAEQHSKMCLIECKDGGYGVSVKKGSEYMFYAFDKKGNDLAEKIAMNTKKMSNITIKVMGTVKDGKLMVESIMELM